MAKCKNNIPIGTRFGRYTVISDETNSSRNTQYLVRCDCGKELVKKAKYLRFGSYVQCKDCSFLEDGIPITHVKMGMRFGTWLVMSEETIMRIKNPLYLCRCDCGLEKYTRVSTLKKRGTCRECWLNSVRRR
jgi:hypothetical protein